MARSGWALRVVVMAAAAAVACAGVVACGSEGGAAVEGEGAAQAREGAAAGGMQKIRPGSRVYVLDDLTAVGFKKGRAYDIEGLPGAVSAYYGFWGPDPYNRKDFEVRFYASHEDAVAQGTAYADERIGRDAKLTVESAMWGEGVKDARECVNVSRNMSHAASCLEPKYFDYVIAGNMVLLCQGRDSLMSLQACDALLKEVGGP